MNELLDLLDDLAHDLGRHVRLPLRLLLEEAPPEAVAEAVRRGVLRTRSGPAGTASATELLLAFEAQVPAGRRSELAPLRAAVEAAVALARLEAPARAEALAILDRIAMEINDLRARWGGDDDR